MYLPKDKQHLLDNITNSLKKIDGIKGVVLGGSYATGMATESSDLDIGIYYMPESPFDIQKIKQLAASLADQESPVVTGFYEWGPWVNGGAWIKTANDKVDFLYKNIEQIIATIDNAQNGIWENHFEQQPPYGFSSIIFLAETHSCIPLFDPEGIIDRLKESVRQYPQKLKHAVVQQSLWAAEFTIWQGESFAAKGDTYNTVGCLTRAVKNIVTALFALNERYPMGDKRAISILEKAVIKPDHLTQKINTVLYCGHSTLVNNVQHLKALFGETVELARGFYQPYYKL